LNRPLHFVLKKQPLMVVGNHKKKLVYLKTSLLE
jgi:hypothetical protein